MIVPGTPLPASESQGGTTITLAIRTPERLRGPLSLIPMPISSPEESPEPQQQPPASTIPARIEDREQGARKRRRMPNKLSRNSQYELRLAETGGSEVAGVGGSEVYSYPIWPDQIMRCIGRVLIYFAVYLRHSGLNCRNCL